MGISTDRVLMVADRVHTIHKRYTAAIVSLLIALTIVSGIEAFNPPLAVAVVLFVCEGAALIYAAYVYQNALRASASIYRLLNDILTAEIYDDH